MDYLKEAKNGEQICFDELRVSDVAEFVKDLNQSKDDYPLALCRIYYAGYSMGFKDGQAIKDAERRADQEGSEPLDVN